MSRRRLNADTLPLPDKPKYKSQFAVNPQPHQEQDHAGKAPLPNADETDAPSEEAAEAQVTPEPVIEPVIERVHVVDIPANLKVSQIDYWMTLYRAKPGSCPICRVTISHGIYGHLLKCQHTVKSSSESTPTT